MSAMAFTDEQLTRLIEALRPSVVVPKPPTFGENDAAWEAKQDEIWQRPKPKRIPHARVKSRTGATFVPIVVESRAFTNGRVTGLDDYRHPEGVETPQQFGGLVPDGKEIGYKTESGQLVSSPQYKQWRYDTFWKRDLQDYVGFDAALLPLPMREDAAK